MSHWAEIKDGKVKRVLVGDSNTPDDGESFFTEVLGGTWVQCSYNTRNGVHYSGERDENGEAIPSDDQSKALRYNYPGAGWNYDQTADAFYPPEPDEDGDWVLDTTTYQWVNQTT
jgi:hypothetical protein